MGRGRQSRLLVAERVRREEHRKTFEAQWPLMSTMDPYSPSAHMRDVGHWVTHSLRASMVYAERQMAYKRKAYKRMQQANLRQKSARIARDKRRVEQMRPFFAKRHAIEQRQSSRRYMHSISFEDYRDEWFCADGKAMNMAGRVVECDGNPHVHSGVLV